MVAGTHVVQVSKAVLPRRRCIDARAQKGFGSGAGDGLRSAQRQVGKRGKVASRPDPQQQIARLQAEEAAFEAGLAAKVAEVGKPSRSMPSGQQPSRMTRTARFGEDDNNEKVVAPVEITDRMLRRMVVFAGIPVLLGVLLLPGFYYLKKVQGLDIPVWAAYITQTLAFGGGLAGISYGIVSSSWDPQREGSRLGWTEFQANLPLLMDRFRPK